MTDRSRAEGPVERLAAVFRDIAATRMAGLPVLNPALDVEAVGFREWNGDRVGVLITPWFMGLICLPGPASGWPDRPSGTPQDLDLPSGIFELLTAYEDTLGPYLTASLFSPMSNFADMGQARSVAEAVLVEIFSPAESSAGVAPGLGRPVSRRGFIGSLLGPTAPR